MGLRCLLGHDFGEPETEREREEEGNEVVVAVREVKTCKTCGETRVVSENKEIKSIEQLRRSAVGETTDGESGGRGTGARPTEPSAGVDPAETVPGRAAQQESRSVADIIQDAETAADSGPETDAVDDSAGVGSVDDGPGPIGGEPPAEGDATNVDEDSGANDAGPADSGVSDADEEDGAETPTHPAQQDAPESEGDADAVEEDAIILDDDDSESEEGREQWEETADPEEIPGPSDAESDDQPNAESDDQPDDDAIIMDDAGTDADQPPKTDDGYTPWPKKEGADEGQAAGVPDDEPTDVEFGSGFTPDDGDADPADQADPRTASDADPQTETDPQVNGAETTATSADSEASDARSGANDVPGTATLDLERSATEAQLEYHCPDCGLTRMVGNSSMRAGDICPECHRGYISERPRRE